MYGLLRRFFGPYRVRATIAVLTKVVEVVFEVMTPLVIAAMIDEGVGAGDVSRVVSLGGLLLAFAAVSYGFTFVCQRLAAGVSQGLGTDVRDALYAHVNELGATQIARFGPASLITRVTSDVNQVQLAVALTIRTVTRWPLLAFGSMVAAVAIEPRLGAVFVVCLPTIFLIFWVVMRSSVPYFRTLQKGLDRISLAVSETLSGMRVIRAFRQEEAEEANMRVAVFDQAATATAQGRLSAVLNPVTFFVMSVGIVCILWFGAGLVNAGELTRGEVMAFVSYMSQALVAVTVMTNLVVLLVRAEASSQRIMEVLECEPDMGWGTRALSADPEVLAVEVEGVSFGYGTGAPAVSGVSFTLPQGQTLGIIGGTGSGKTTLVNLIVRLFDAHEGVVRLFGQDVREVSAEELRRAVSVVPQQVSLVSGSIRDNLRWRDDEATDEELWQALELAQARSFVEALPLGLDEHVEARGQNFSGGQRQRLSIARALVGRPRLLVLDDAASALDFATDAALRRALKELSGELTLIIVSQRVSAVMGADQILVLDHGQVAGLGRHERLVRKCQLYNEICASQLKLGGAVRARGED